MSIARASLEARRLVLVTLFFGCIGMRTPLDDASTPIGDGSDWATKRDVFDSPGDKAIGDAFDSAEATCGSTMTIRTRPAEASILVLLDRSNSMDWNLSSDEACTPGMSNCTPRMPAVVSGVGTVVTDNPDIRWGLMYFPTPNADTCANVSSTPQVEVAANTEDAIKSQLATINTSLGTQTRSAITAATTYLRTLKDHSDKVILLATDGYPNCHNYASTGTVGIDDMDGTAAEIGKANDAGFPVYVIGIGPGVSNLNALAVAGGTGSYHPATSTAGLTNALRSIVQAVTLTCRFKATMIPPDKALATVSVDNNLVPNDDNDGWMFDPADPTSSTIVLTGSYCQNVVDGATSQVQIVFGCPEANQSRG